MSQKKRLLPLDAYPATLSEAQRDRVDARIASEMHLIPTEPGVYTDRSGDTWILDDLNQWTDNSGITKTAEYTPSVIIFGPFAKKK